MRWLSPLEYEQAQPFGYPDKIAWVKKNSKWGTITPQGKLVIPFVYDQAEEFVSDRALVRLDKVWGFVDAKRNKVIPFLYEEARSFRYNTLILRQKREVSGDLLTEKEKHSSLSNMTASIQKNITLNLKSR